MKSGIGIRISSKGDFSKASKYFRKLETVLETKQHGILDKYGRRGVEALAAATPVDTGLTASSWSYEIIRDDKTKTVTLSFNNSNVVNDWCNIAIILQYGHATRNGGYVEGRDYINPAIQPIFDKIADEAWEEVTKI